MKIGLVSDLHANSAALSAVLKKMHGLRIHRLWVLGDLIGYGLHPVETIQQLNRFSKPYDWVEGNHEVYFNLDNINDADLGHKAKTSTRWMKEYFCLDGNSGDMISKASHQKESILFKNLDGVDYLLTHNLLNGYYDNVQKYGEYLFPWESPINLTRAAQEFQSKMQTKFHGFTVQKKIFSSQFIQGDYLPSNPMIGLYGHTHVQSLLYYDDPCVCNSIQVEIDKQYDYGDYPLVFINPGSVGQPRDANSASAFAILDTQKRQVTFKRVQYEKGKLFLEYIDKSKDPSSGDCASSLQMTLSKASFPDTHIPEEWVKFLHNSAKRSYE